MNELIFLFHVLVVVAFALVALRLGKSALIAFIVLQGVLANLFVVKQMTLFGFSVTCSDVFAVGGILSLNLLQEYFGKEAAQRAIPISGLALVFFTCMAWLHLRYVPAPFDMADGAFQTIFSTTPRIVFASIATFYVVQQVDVRLFGLLKGKLPVRVALSLLCSQLLDTALFSFLGLYGWVASLFDIMLVSYLIKCLIIAASAPFVALSKRIVKDVPV